MTRAEIRARWRAIVNRQIESGITVAAFCRREKITPSKFYRWRRIFEQETLEEQPPGPVNALVPVQVIASSELQIDLPCGASLKVPVSKEQLRLVLGTLLELGHAND